MRHKISLLLLWFSLLSAKALDAHPMGNFSINHHSTIRLRQDGASIRYILDFAEIPTFQMHAEASPEEWVRDLRMESDGVPQPLQLINVHRELLPGAAGLSTMKI